MIRLDLFKLLLEFRLTDKHCLLQKLYIFIRVKQRSRDREQYQMRRGTFIDNSWQILLVGMVQLLSFSVRSSDHFEEAICKEYSQCSVKESVIKWYVNLNITLTLSRKSIQRVRKIKKSLSPIKLPNHDLFSQKIDAADDDRKIGMNSSWVFCGMQKGPG